MIWTMKTPKLTKIQKQLLDLEKRIQDCGVRLGYERLQFAGLRLRSGLCRFRGRYYLFVDRFKTAHERVELLQNALEDLRKYDKNIPPEPPLASGAL
jgi:hypothetical protein